MATWQEYVYVWFVISVWEIGKRILNKLSKHRHKWINLGEDPKQWATHIASSSKGGGWANVENLLSSYTHGRFCLKCKQYEFVKRSLKGKVISKLNFAQQSGGV